MTLKSYKEMRKKELRDGMRKRHVLAGELVQRNVRLRTPVGTPETTAKPDYKITEALRQSIVYVVDTRGENVQIGTNKEYAKWVHNGTLQSHHRTEWDETSAQEWYAIYQSQYPDYKGPGHTGEGMKPRAFLVNGLLQSRPALRTTYGREIIGKPPHGKG